MKKKKEPKNLADIARKKRYLHLIEKLHSGKSLTKQEIHELEQFEADPLDPNVVKTLEEVAKAMGVSYRTVFRWKKDGMPLTKEGFYDLEEINKWHSLNNTKSKSKKGKDFWDEKIRKYKAELLKLELDKANGKLILAAEVEKGRVERILVVKRAFLALPTRMAPILAMKEPREIETLLYDAIGEIIDEFAGVRRDPIKEEGNESKEQE